MFWCSDVLLAIEERFLVNVWLWIIHLLQSTKFEQVNSINHFSRLFESLDFAGSRSTAFNAEQRWLVHSKLGDFACPFDDQTTALRMRPMSCEVCFDLLLVLVLVLMFKLWWKKVQGVKDEKSERKISSESWTEPFRRSLSLLSLKFKLWL